MADRDLQTVLLSRPTLLLVTGVGVGLMTLSYVLGVQVGKQSAALRRNSSQGAGEEMVELPMTMEEQLKAFEELDRIQRTPVDSKTEAKAESKADAKVDAKTEEPAKPELKADAKPEKKAEAKAESKPAPKVEPKPGEGRWTLQLVATPDAGEAKRVADKAKAAGFATTTLKDQNQFKVRLAQSLPKAESDAAAAKLQASGLKSFPLKTP